MQSFLSLVVLAVLLSTVDAVDAIGDVDTISTVRGVGAGGDCPSDNYKSSPGDVPGGGSISGRLPYSYQECADACDRNPACNSFEHSEKRMLCNLNSETSPTKGSYQDFVFCVKITGNAITLGNSITPLNCIALKGAEELELQEATNGYDVVMANPDNPRGDPGIRNRIFHHDCKTEDGDYGYYDFVSDIRPNVNCQTDFSAKSVRSYSDYLTDRSSSNSFGVGASISVSGSYLGFSAGFAAGFAFESDSSEREIKEFFEVKNGEIIVATAACHTDVVALATFVRPKFTKNFINGMNLLSSAIGKSEAVQQSAVVRFVETFGTHYMTKSNFGARLIYESLFTSKSTDTSQQKARYGCTKLSASACISGGGWGVEAEACVGLDTSKCGNSTVNQGSGSGNSIESTRTISIGSRPKSLSEWAGDDFSPVVIQRELASLSNLFKPEWLTEADYYGINKPINGIGIKNLFERQIRRYCEVILGKTAEECQAKLTGCGIAGDCPIGKECVNDKSVETGYRCVTTVLDPQCFKPYYTLEDMTRVSSFYRTPKDNPFSGSNPLFTDNSRYPKYLSLDWKGVSWYRFSADAGLKMPETPPPEYSCGTRRPGWLSGGPHPSITDGVVDRTACFVQGSDTCDNRFTQKIKVVNCGDQFLYWLPDTRSYQSSFRATRYCGLGQ